MKIVYICDFFHPEAGYHPNILSKIWSSQGHKVYMITSEMEKIPKSLTSFFSPKNIEEKDKIFEKNTGVEVIRIPLIAFISGRSIYSFKIFKVIDSIKPDVVYVNGNDTAIGILLTLRYNKLNYGLVMDSHMLEMASSNRFNSYFRLFYKKIITPIIIDNGITVIRTQDDPYVEKCLGLPLEKSPYISFGTDMDFFHPSQEQRKRFRNNNDISDNALVFIYAGKLDQSKGADLLASAIKNKITSNKEIVFVIVGNTDGEFGENIEKVLSDSQNRIIRFPTQRYQDLPMFYQAADIAIFPKQCSLSFFDAQACGLPVIFEDNNINIDRGGHQNALVFSSNSIEGLRNSIISFAEMNNEKVKCYSEAAYNYIKNNFSCAITANEYMKYLEVQKIKKDNKNG